MKTSMIALALLAGTAPLSIAQATTFTGNYTVATHTTGDGLLMNSAKTVPTLSFTLTQVGQSYAYDDLFALWTDEGDVGGDDLGARAINVLFQFSDPLFTGTASGETAGVRQVFGMFQNGRLDWDNGGVFEFAYGNGGRLGLTLTGGTFNSGMFGLSGGQARGLNVDATFTLNAAAVPEPASWAMMIGGFAMVGGAMRRRVRSATVIA